MAVVDPSRNAVVIRIVYDGPPFAGKTTSVQALGRSLTRTVETPLAIAGRTQYFDWMEYTGGLFEGYQIRCQIVSVPGQDDLTARRRALLESADVVVFVADTGDRDAVERSARHVRDMVEVVGRAEVPVGIVVQANKRDLPDAVPRDDVRAALGDQFSQTALTESVAEAGQGIRETFVLAVRLALDRVRALMKAGAVPRRPPTIDTAEALLASLEELPAAPPLATGATLEAALLEATAAPVPRLPDARVPSGAIWPPVEGRMVLHEATSSPHSVRRLADGSWVAGLGSAWRLHSEAAARYEDFDAGRQGLVAWARTHAVHGPLLSPSRCIVLADTGRDEWRIWQIVQVTPSLRSWLADHAGQAAADLLGRLGLAAEALGDSELRFADSWLTPTLDSLGWGPRGAQFVALMPSQAAPRPSPATSLERRVVAQLATILGGELAERRAELRAAAAAGPVRSRWDRLVAATLDEPAP